MEKNLGKIIGFSVLAFIILLTTFGTVMIKKHAEPVEKEEIQFLQGGDISKAEQQVVEDSIACSHLEAEVKRYEKAFRIFLRRNPKAAEQFADIISDETE